MISSNPHLGENMPVATKVLESFHDYIEYICMAYQKQHIDLRHSSGTQFLNDLIRLYRLIKIEPSSLIVLNDKLPDQSFFTETVFLDIPAKWQHFHFEKQELYYYWSLIESRLTMWFRHDILPVEWVQENPEIRVFDAWTKLVEEGCKHIDSLIWNFSMLTTPQPGQSLYDKLLAIEEDGKILQCFLDTNRTHNHHYDDKRTTIYTQSYIIIRFQKELFYYPQIHSKINKPLLKLLTRYEVITFKKLAQILDVNRLVELSNLPSRTPVLFVPL